MPSDEPRRSVRATRGQHSKIDLDQAPPPKQVKATKKGKKAQKVQEKQEEEDDDGPMRCICGATTEDPEDDQPWIACDTCHAWQHNICMGMSEWEEDQPDQYFCEQCKPENHKELLAAMAKGQKPWVARHASYLIRKGEEQEKKREEEEKKREAQEKRKRGKKGKRVSDQSSRRSRGADATPAATPEPKAEPQPQEPKSAPKPEPKPEPKVVKKEKAKTKEKKEPEKAIEKKVPEKAPEKIAEKMAEKVAEKVVEKAVEKVVEKKVVAEKVIEKKVAERKEPEKEKEKPTPKAKSQKRREPPQDEPKGPEPKLRKGSEGQAIPASPVEIQTPAILALSEDRQGPAKALTKTMIHCVRSSTVVKLDGPSSQTRAEEVAVAIEAAVYNSHPNHNSYAQQCRTLNYNLKHNQELCDRLLKGELTPEALSTMTAAEMQTKEQQLKDAEMRAKAAKQATLSDENTGPRIKRTHKGDELVDDDNSVMEDAPSAIFRRPSMKEKDAQPLQVDTQHSRKGSDFDFKKVMSSVSPTSTSYRRQSQPVGPGEDADVDRMLGESPPYSPVADKDPDKVWEGKVMMQSLADYFADAKWAAGVDPTQSVGISWEQLIPHELAVAGRIDTPVANTYLCSLRYSNLDVSVVTLRPTYPAGKEHHQAIIDYLLSKNRFAVISNRPAPNDVLKIVDMYLAACPAGSGDAFEFVLNLNESIIPKDRPEPLLIAVLVLEMGPQAAARKATMLAAAASGTDSNGGVAAAKQPTAPNGGHVTGGPLPDLTRSGSADTAKEVQRQQQQRAEQMAHEILGPELYNTPTLKFLLPMAHRMTSSEWVVIKSIYESDHRAREDLNQLNAAIEMRAKEKTQPAPAPAPAPAQPSQQP